MRGNRPGITVTNCISTRRYAWWKSLRKEVMNIVVTATSTTSYMGTAAITSMVGRICRVIEGGQKQMLRKYELLWNFINENHAMDFSTDMSYSQKKGFHYPIVFLYAESDSVNNSYQWRSPMIQWVWYKDVWASRGLGCGLEIDLILYFINDIKYKMARRGGSQRVSYSRKRHYTTCSIIDIWSKVVTFWLNDYNAELND